MKRNLIRYFGSLGWRILFWMTVVALVPLCIMAYQSYYYARQAIVASEEGHLKAVLELRKARLEAWIAERKADILFLAETTCFQQMPEKSECNILDSISHRSPSYETLVFYNPDWKRIGQSSQMSHPDIEFLDSGFKAKLQNADGLVISQPHPHPDGRIGLHIGYSTSVQDRGKTGFIAANLNLSKTLDPIMLDRAGLGDTGKVYLLSSRGNFLTIPPTARDLLNQKSPIPTEWLSEKMSTVREYKDYQGNMVLGVSANIAQLNMVLIAEMDQSEAFRWLQILRSRAIVTGSITFFVVLFIAWRRSKSLSRPLKELANVASKISKGHHHERLENLDGTEAREVAGVFNDMLDELAKSQQRLIHATSLAAVGELSSSIVHEIRNPLSSVKLNLHALRRKVKDDKTYSELADIAYTQVDRIERMLSDLLGYGKPVNLKLKTLKFKDIAEEVVDIVRHEVEEKNISIEIKDHIERTGFVADPEQTRRALTNLVSNAVLASPKDGKVAITARIIVREKEKVAISVMDNGSGIPENQKEKMFHPFFTTRENGTGLGLANVKKIMDYHGGSVFFENRSEGGALFTMCFPVRGTL